jgi:Tol biopolymer transport system component
LDDPYHSSLYSVPITGGPVTRLSSSEKGVEPYFAITPDGRRVVFATEPAFELANVPLTGGPVTKLSGPAASGVNFVEFAISPDSRWVVYQPEDFSKKPDLYSVPLTGGPVAKLTPPFVGLQGYDIIWQFAISPDSQRVVYLRGNDTPYYIELYSVPISGGALTKLNPPLGSFFHFKISRDSRHVIYRGYQDSHQVGQELYSMPIAGGTVIKLNAPLVLYGSVSNFDLSPDNRSLIYVADQEVHPRLELYQVALTGGPVTKVNAPLGLDGIVRIFNGRSGEQPFQFTPDGCRVVYSAQYEGAQDHIGPINLYSASVACERDDDTHEEEMAKK